MSKLSVTTLYSGSKGNSILVRTADTNILFDAGLSCGMLCKSLASVGISPDNLNSVFITHEHSDHVSALDVFSKHYSVPIHVTEQSYHGIKCNQQVTKIHDPLYSVSFNDCEISSFVTPHDSRMSVGFIVRTDFGNIGIVTDLGYMPDEIIETLSYCDTIILESNHDEKMLINGPYPPSLKKRILSDFGHLSNKNCAEAAGYLASCGTKNIMLAHLSEHNNTPELAYTETRRKLDSLGYSFVNLKVASGCSATVLI